MPDESEFQTEGGAMLKPCEAKVVYCRPEEATTDWCRRSI